MREVIHAQQHETQRRGRAVVYRLCDVFFKFYLVVQAGNVVDFVFLAQVGDETGKKRRFTVFIPFQIPTAAYPDAVRVGPAVGDDLVGFKKGGLVVRMDPFAPDCGGIGNNFARQAEIIDHGFGITEDARRHFGDIDIGVRAAGEGVVKLGGAAAQAVLDSGGACFAQPPGGQFDMSLFFLLIHAFIGLGENGRQGQLHVRAYLKTAEAETQFVFQAQRGSSRFQIMKHIFKAEGRRVAVQFMKNNHELVAAQAETEIRPGQTGFNLPRHKVDGRVADHVPEGVVDIFKVIEVKKGHDKRRVSGPGLVDSLGQPFKTGPAVQQAREIVAGGLAPQAFAVGDVNGLLQMHQRSVAPAHQAVVVFKETARPRIMFFPAVYGVIVKMSAQMVHRAEFATP